MKANAQRRFTSLSEFVVEQQRYHPDSTGELSRLLTSIRLAAKLISREVSKAGLVEDIIGGVGSENVQGEQQQKLDVYANVTFINAMRNQGVVCGVASEEDDEAIVFDGQAAKGNYVVTMDPLDGSSNIDVNVSIGTIFSVYKRLDPNKPISNADFLQPGTAQVAAGYVIYGSSTMLVYTTGHGVNGFTLDPSIGVFCLSNPDMRSPQDGKIFSVNEGNYNEFHPGVKAYIDEQKAKKHSARYIGSLVADFHRNLLKGGMYLYPGTTGKPQGKLRLLYEANPLAFIVEQAGGVASNGHQRIMEIVPNELHQRVPLYIGSKNMVEDVTARLQSEG